MPTHYPSICYEKYAGKDPNTEVRIFWYEWGICAAVLDYETGDVLEHIDMLTQAPPLQASPAPTFAYEELIEE